MSRTATLTILTLLSTSPAIAGGGEPCEIRTSGYGVAARDGRLEGNALSFCTRKHCWSLDLASRTFSPIRFTPEKPKAEPYDEQGNYKLESGRASATPTSVTFCPGGGTPCKTYKYKFKFDGAQTVVINDEGTLGALTYAGISEEGDPTYVVLYDLAKPKPIKQLKADAVNVFGSTFLVDDIIYSAAGKKIGALKDIATSSEPVRLGTTSLVAMSYSLTNDLVIVDVAAAKVKHRLKLDLKVPKNEVADPYVLVPSRDGAQLHVIAGSPFTGEVVTLDVASGKQVARSTPPICAP